MGEVYEKEELSIRVNFILIHGLLLRVQVRDLRDFYLLFISAFGRRALIDCFLLFFYYQFIRHLFLLPLSLNCGRFFSNRKLWCGSKISLPFLFIVHLIFASLWWSFVKCILFLQFLWYSLWSNSDHVGLQILLQIIRLIQFFGL